MSAPRIADIRAYIVETEASAVPPTDYAPYLEAEHRWGVGGLDTVLVEVETEAGLTGIALGKGGPPVCFLIEAVLKRYLEGADPRDVARLWETMFRAMSTDLGRTGVALLAISAVDLAIWDLLGRLRGEPVYKLIGGATKDRLPVYYTGERAAHGKALGFPAAKVSLPHPGVDGAEGFEANVAFLAENRAEVGEDYPFAVDCWMSLDVRYALDLAAATAPLSIRWFEEPLPPEDLEGCRRLMTARPDSVWTTGEHHYRRYGFRPLIAERAADIVQPDLQYCGGLSEALRIAAMAAASDIPLSPHCGGVYAYHFAMSQPNVPFVEYFNESTTGEALEPVHGAVVRGEPLPKDGAIELDDAPGWGLELSADAAGILRRCRLF